MRFAIFLGVLALSLASGALFLNDSLSDLLRDQMRDLEFSEVVGFDHVGVTSKHDVSVRGASLKDPGTGRVVAFVNQLDLRFDVPWEDRRPAPVVESIHGRGGRVLLRYEAGDLGLVRAISALVDGILAMIPESAPGVEAEASLMPALFFEDIEVLVYSEGLPLERYSSTSVRIRELDPEILEVMVATGPDGGTLQLLFDDDGLTRLEFDGLHVSPAVTTLDPSCQDILMNGFALVGELDAVVDLASEEVSGTLYQAYVDSDQVPFRLGPATIPFHVDDQNVLHIDEAHLGFDGGTVVLSLAASEHVAKMRLDVEDSEFREQIMQLIPGYEDWVGVEVADGGSFECHLDLTLGGEYSESSVSGDGGFHIGSIVLGPYGIELQDVVGRFEVTEQDVLSFPEVSARALGGRVRASGTLGLLDDLFRVDLSVEDLDVAELHRLRAETVERTDKVAGWLQARIQGRGRLKDPESYVADGQVSVRAGNFWDTPTFEQILKVLTLSSNVDGHQRVDAGFLVRDRIVRLEPLEIQSDVLSLSGYGTIRFNGSIRFELRPAPVRLGMFGKVLDTLKEELLVKLSVRGTVDDPRVTATPLNIVARPFRSFWNFLFGAPAEPGLELPAAPSDG